MDIYANSDFQSTEIYLNLVLNLHAPSCQGISLIFLRVICIWSCRIDLYNLDYKMFCESNHMVLSGYKGHYFTRQRAVLNNFHSDRKNTEQSQLDSSSSPVDGKRSPQTFFSLCNLVAFFYIRTCPLFVYIDLDMYAT